MGDYYCVNCGDKFDEKPGRYETFGYQAVNSDSNEQPSDKPLTLNSSTEKNLSGESIASDGVADKTRNPENEKTADSGKIPDKSAEGDAVNEFSDGTAENGGRAVGKGENCFRCCPCCPISLVLTVMASSAQSEREEISRLNVANVINIVAVVSTLILVFLFFIGMF